jgi:hypothetical protein
MGTDFSHAIVRESGRSSALLQKTDEFEGLDVPRSRGMTT